MGKFSRVFGSRALGVILSATSAIPALAADLPPDDSAIAALPACFAAQTSATPFAGIVMAYEGETIFSRVEGTVDGVVPPEDDQRYPLASVGKVLTQLAIARLVDQGRIRLDAPISTYLPELPAEFGAVTVNQLLHHRAGVFPATMMTPDLVETLLGARSQRDLLPIVVNKPLAFAPGAQVQYSNGGYFVLGAIIEAVSSLSYAGFVEAEILRPLGMTRTGFVATGDTAEPLTRMAGPGQPRRAEPAPMRGFPVLPGTAAGDGVSTAGDLLKLARALADDRLVSQETRAVIFPRRGEVWQIGQGGGRPGANAYFMVHPERDAAVVVLTNYDPPAGELMGAVLGNVLAGQSCRPLTEADRPSPMRIMPPPPPPS
jgi:CubicO group peptidase (beta-lactamase class C family)